MKSTEILDVMVKDHNRLMEYLSDVESNQRRDSDLLRRSFNTFQWNLEKHFFVEERAIFTSYNPNKIIEGYEVFLDLSKQHTKILEKVESLRSKLQDKNPFDVTDLKQMLVKHKTFEEKKVYPVLDQEIDEGEKRFIIERINEMVLK